MLYLEMVTFSKCSPAKNFSQMWSFLRKCSFNNTLPLNMCSDVFVFPFPVRKYSLQSAHLTKMCSRCSAPNMCYTQSTLISVISHQKVLSSDRSPLNTALSSNSPNVFNGITLYPLWRTDLYENITIKS